MGTSRPNGLGMLGLMASAIVSSSNCSDAPASMIARIGIEPVALAALSKVPKPWEVEKRCNVVIRNILDTTCDPASMPETEIFEIPEGKRCETLEANIPKIITAEEDCDQGVKEILATCTSPTVTQTEAISAIKGISAAFAEQRKATFGTYEAMCESSPNFSKVQDLNPHIEL